MKILTISVHFEFSEIIETLLDRCNVGEYVRIPMIEGKDCDGKHMSSQVYPGSITLYRAILQDDQIDAVFAELEKFRNQKTSHRHLNATLVSIEKSIGMNEKGGRH